MSPDFLYSSYMRYKADTDAVATWLLDTAVGRGYNVARILNNAETAVKVPRLKGKARQLARASKSPAGVHGKPITGAYRITINDFTTLAEFVARVSKPCVKVPQHFVLQLRQAINTRKSHQAWYESRLEVPVEPVASECGHAYFIHTLESVTEILRPILPETFRSDRQDANTGSSPLANMFEHLVVKETLETNSDSKAEPQLSAPTRISATVESPDTGHKQEASLASVFLSRDVHRLRGVVQKIWKDYHEGKVGLVAASITTNTAIDFCRRLQEDFEKAFPVDENSHERACTYCVFLEDTKKKDSGTLQSDGPCLATVYGILGRFIDEIKDDPSGEMPTVSAAYIQPYLEDTKSIKGGDEFLGHYALLMGILPELCALVLTTTPHCERLHAEHEIMRAMRYLLSCGTQTLWVTFAFQVLLDIRHIMREDITWAFDDLCQGSKLITSNIENVLKFNVDTGVTHLSRILDQPLNQILDQVKRWTEQDSVCMLIEQTGELEDASTARRHIPPYYLLKRDPLWCGTLLYSFRTVAHEASIAVANSWSCIPPTAHLYNSFRQSGLLASQWEDMECIISMHGAENIFVGAIPTDFPDCLKHFSLATGLRVSELAPNQRRKGTSAPYLKWRRLKQLTPVSLLLFKGRFCNADGRTNLGPDDVVKALRQKAAEESAEIYQMSPGDDVCDIIEKLRLAVEHETAQMTFNHFGMHVSCSKLLRLLHVAVGPSIYNWEEEYRDERNLPGIVLAVLMEATRGHSLVFEAGEVVEGFVARNGDLALRDIWMIDAIAGSRRATASNRVVGQCDASQLLAS